MHTRCLAAKSQLKGNPIRGSRIVFVDSRVEHGHFRNVTWDGLFIAQGVSLRVVRAVHGNMRSIPSCSAPRHWCKPLEYVDPVGNYFGSCPG